MRQLHSRKQSHPPQQKGPNVAAGAKCFDTSAFEAPEGKANIQPIRVARYGLKSYYQQNNAIRVLAPTKPDKASDGIHRL